MTTWYRTGTVSVTNGSATVTGAGTAFSANVAVGEEFRLSGGATGYEITAVVSDTQLTLSRGYLASTQSGQAYEIVPVRGFLRQAYDALSSAVNQFAAYQAGALSGRFGSGTASEPGIAFADDVNTGMRRVSSDTVALVAGGVDQLSLSGGVATGAVVQSSAVDGNGEKLMRVGAFGLGAGGDASVLADLDDFDTRAGLYAITTATVGDRPAGATNFAFLLVMRQAVTGVLQIYINSNGEELAFRTATSGVWGDWEFLVGSHNLLGTVSQSGGAPTGAVIESGSNANGEYTRWADGTQICTHKLSFSDITTAAGGIYHASADLTWTFPAAFVAAPSVSAGGASSSIEWAGVFCGTTTFALVRPMRATSSIGAKAVSVMAVGRWF